jgi:hypothetical protein
VVGPGGYYRHIGATLSLINFRYVLWMEEMDIHTENPVGEETLEEEAIMRGNFWFP